MGVSDRLALVRAQIESACERAGRDPETVQLLAVSKRQSAEAIRAAFAAGQRQFGENRVQELAAKSVELAGVDLDWHMVGSLQTNKVRDVVTVPRLALLHTVDRRKLADRLQEELDALDRDLSILVQVNAAREEQKHGVAPDQTGELFAHLGGACPRLLVRGLMAMGPLEGDPAPVFKMVSRLRSDLQDRFGLDLPVLSLGMTGDLDEAVAAGSTLVRVGTGVFGPRA